jgi:hypothetical protein
MTVPVFAEFIAIFLNFIEKKHMEQPEVLRITAVKEVEPFEACKKCSPTSSKVSAAFQPEPFDTSVMSRPEITR